MNIFIREAMDEDVYGLNTLSVQLGYAMPVDTTWQNLRAILQNNYEKIFVAVNENK